MNSKEKVSLLHSIKTKINLLVLGAIAAVVLMLLWTIIPLVKENMSGTTQSYMKDVALVAGASIDREIGQVGVEKALTMEELGAVVSDISIQGMSSSYAYVVSKDGTMLYHPSADKIGSMVENDAVNGSGFPNCERNCSRAGCDRLRL